MTEYPQYLFYASVGLLVVPAALFCRVAAIVLLVFLVSFGSPVAKLAALWLAFGACMWVAQNSVGLLVGSLYLSLAAVASFEATGLMHPYYAYWYDFWIGMARNLLLPFSCDWPRAEATWKHGWRGYWSVRTRYDGNYLVRFMRRLRSAEVGEFAGGPRPA